MLEFSPVVVCDCFCCCFHMSTRVSMAFIVGVRSKFGFVRSWWWVWFVGCLVIFIVSCVFLSMIMATSWWFLSSSHMCVGSWLCCVCSSVCWAISWAIVVRMFIC